MRREDILAAFKLFDKDGSGYIDKSELYDILTYKGSGRSVGIGDQMARDIIEEFDKNGDGVLSVEEFAEALSAIGNDVEQNDSYQNDLYDRRAKAHMAAIKELFDKVDVSGTGKLSMEELKEVVSFYEGAEFDEATFLEWYETNHAIHVGQLGAQRLDKLEQLSAGWSDGQLDLTEFSWCVPRRAAALGTNPEPSPHAGLTVGSARQKPSWSLVSVHVRSPVTVTLAQVHCRGCQLRARADGVDNRGVRRGHRVHCDEEAKRSQLRGDPVECQPGSPQP